MTDSGVLALDSDNDFEEPADADGTYEVTVQVSDGDNDVTADLLVVLGNVIELEAIVGPETVTFEENSWSRVATLTASSDEDRDGVSWSLGGTDAGHFHIDEPAGVLRFDLDAVSPVIVSKPPDFETPVDVGADSTYVVTLTPSAGSDSGTPLRVTVTDVTTGTETWVWERCTGYNQWAAIKCTITRVSPLLGAPWPFC